MNHVLGLITIIICFLSISVLNAQDINKMSKSDLRENVLFQYEISRGLSTQIDSLKNVIFTLEESKDSLLLNVSFLESANDMNEIELAKLNNVALKNKQEIARLQSDHVIQIASLNETIFDNQASLADLQDSILRLQKVPLESQVSFLDRQDSISRLQEDLPQNSMTSNQSSTTTSDDFLNKYYFDQIPLSNNSFQLVLSKIILGGKCIHRGDGVGSIPETLDCNAFSFWGIAPDVALPYGTKIDDVLIRKDKSYFDSNLPQIEILKNKLFTIRYNDNTEESFLFNVKESVPNNGRKGLQINLANEGFESNTANDIIWQVVAINNECYLAITTGQLERLKIYISAERVPAICTGCPDGFGYDGDGYGYGGVFIRAPVGANQYESWRTTGKGMLLMRKKDSYLNRSEPIQRGDLTFLLKMKEL